MSKLSTQKRPMPGPLVATALGLLVSSQALAQTSDKLLDLLPVELKDCVAPAMKHSGYERQSVYVPAEDGVRLAVDVFLPAGRSAQERLPTLYTATRYGRARAGEPLSAEQEDWLERGFAVVNADVRGTGASFGQWYIPYSHAEAKDIGDLARWIARQPWSNGKVVMTGNSYPGTTALVGAAYAGGVIKATAPKFSDFDLYTDLLFPGGIPAEGLIVSWGKMVRELDLNQGPDSVRPVDGQTGNRLLAAAIDAHKVNPHSFDRAAYELTYKDEPADLLGGMTLGDGGAFNLRPEIERSRVPIFGWGSWLDSGIAQGLLNRFMTFTNAQLTIIGPWTHGAKENVNVYEPGSALDPSREMQQHLIECYLTHYVSSDHPSSIADHSLFYFTMGENKWKLTHDWPVPGTRQKRYFLDEHNSLSVRSPREKGLDPYTVDFDASTGPANRWATQAGGPRIDYGDRSEADRKLLTYTGQALTQDMELTGQPVVTLRVSSTHTDGNFIVYLEDVAPGGRTTYITEGHLRAIHRKLSKDKSPYETTYPYRTFAKKDAEPLVPGQMASLTFQLQATSVLFRVGHRIRLAIAGADKGTFLRIPQSQQPVVINVSRGGAEPSFIDLPIVPPQRRPMTADQ